MKRLRTGVTELDLLRDLMLGGQHSRQNGRLLRARSAS